MHNFRQRNTALLPFRNLHRPRQIRGEVISLAISDIPNESGVMAAAVVEKEKRGEWGLGWAALRL